MKIKVKGFKSLIKAVRNRAHLFPVKVLIRAKNKTYYGIRYKTGNKAMEFTKKQMKIPNTVEVLFDTIDGKRKNITENDVLRIYDKAGKPGSLQEFIAKNFKKPYVKPRNSTTVDLKQQQMSIDDLIQGNEPTEDVKVKDDKQETQAEDKDTKRKEYRLKTYERKYNDGSYEIDTEKMGSVFDENYDIAERETDRRRLLAIKLNNEIYHMKNNANFSDLSTYEAVRKDYLRHKELRNILTDSTLREPYISSNSDRPSYWQKAVEVGVRELSDLLEFDNDYKNGKYDNYNVQYDYIPRMLCQQGANVWGRYRLYFNAAGDSIIDRIVSEQNIDKDSQDYDALKFYTHSMYLDLDKDKLFISRDGNTGLHLDNSTREKILTYAREKINELESEKTGDENKPSKDSIMTIEQEKMLLRRLKARRLPDNPFIIRPDEGAMMRLTGIRDYNNMNGEPTAPGRAQKISRTLDRIRLDLNTGKATVEGTKDSETLSIAQGAIDKLISEIKAETQGNEPTEPEKKEQIEKLAFRNVGIDGGLINFIKTRAGTTKIKSKNEYKQVKNITELVDRVKPIKDAHTNIKGRAIMDMLGIGADLITKADGKPFPIGAGAVGYCMKQYNKKTGEAHIVEIGLVADRNSPAAETKTAIHECMHAKIGMSGKNKLIEARFLESLKGEHMHLKIEEPMVELAGQALTRQIHGDEARKNMHSYATFISSFLPRVWSSDIFKDARKQGALGIGQEIANQLINGNTDFINKVYDSFNANDDKKANSNRMKAIEWAIIGNQNKADKIQTDTGKSEIANLVEELKKGTISLEGALNSSQYREIAAILITKFLEDEDLDILEGAANEIKYGNADSAEMMASGRIPF